MTARDLTKRYILALGIVALMASIILGLSLSSTHQASSDANLINKAGRQRMLSQRISLLSFEYTNIALAGSHDTVRERLEGSIDLFLRSHDELAAAADRQPEIASIYHEGGMSLDVLSQAFVADARDILENGGSDTRIRRLALDAEIILPRLDEATNAFELASNRRAQFTERLEWTAFFITLFVLCLEAFFIFRPAARSLGGYIARLNRAREDAEAGARAKTTFLANMSHEIRTPLNGVLGMAEALTFTELDGDQREKIRTIQGSGDLLLAVVNDILDLTKIDSGNVKLETIPFEMATLAQWAEDSFVKPSDDKDLMLRVDLDPAAEDRFLGDPTRLRQVLANLLSNAIKFTDSGQVALTVRHAAATDRIEIAVSDTGVGIPEERLAAIFDPFVQADVSTTRTHGGTGLGLSISKRLIEMMGGTIRVESEIGTGTTFTVELPLTRTDAPVRDADTSALDAYESSLAGQRILVVDDIATNRLVLFSILKSMEVEAVLVESGAEAIEICRSESFNAILMDIRMPGMNGPDATRAIRRMESELGLQPTPIIAATANALPEQTASYRAAGMDGSVTKPVVLEELVRELARLTRPDVYRAECKTG